MSHPAKMWFRQQTGWWCVTLDGKKFPLAKGRENRSEAQLKFHELMSLETREPSTPDATLADLIEEFLVWSSQNLAVDTHRVYRGYAQLLAEKHGQLLISEFKPYHLTKWIDSNTHWNVATKHNAFRVARRVFSWAVEQGYLATNPLFGTSSSQATATRTSDDARRISSLVASHEH